MSLINEALKKAQERQNAPRTQANQAQPGATQVYQAPKTQHNFILYGIVAFVALAFVAGGTGLIVYGLMSMNTDKSSTKESIAQTTSPPGANLSNPVSELENAALPNSELERISFEVDQPKSTPETQIEISNLQAAIPAEELEKRISEQEVATTAALEKQPSTEPATSETAPTTTSPETTPAPVEKLTPTPDPEIQSYINALEVRGIMASAEKVLIFDPASGTNTAYEKGRSLNTTLGIIVSEINPRSIEFTDNDGYIYTKRF